MKYTAVELAAHFAQRCTDPTATRDGWMVCCPAHNDTNASLHITPGDGCILLHCFAGCTKSAIVAALGMTLADLFVSHRRPLPAPGSRAQSPRTPKPILDAPARRARLKQIWRQARPITLGDPVGRYLTRRGLWHDTMPKTLRYHPHLPYHHGDGTFTYLPALVSVIQAPDGLAIAVHRIYVSNSGQKAAVPHPKKLFIVAPWHGSAVRLDPAGVQIIVTEGVETGLAVRRTTGYPTWAAISAGGMRALVVPPVVELVVIAADHDVSGGGQEAARKLAHRLLQEGRRVKIVTPQTPGTDWADALERAQHG